MIEYTFNAYIVCQYDSTYMDLMGIWKQINLIQFQGSSMVNWSMWSSVWNLGIPPSIWRSDWTQHPYTFEHWTWTYAQLALHPKDDDWNELTTLSISCSFFDSSSNFLLVVGRNLISKTQGDEVWLRRFRLLCWRNLALAHQPGEEKEAHRPKLLADPCEIDIWRISHTGILCIGYMMNHDDKFWVTKIVVWRCSSTLPMHFVFDQPLVVSRFPSFEFSPGFGMLEGCIVPMCAKGVFRCTDDFIHIPTTNYTLED